PTPTVTQSGFGIHRRHIRSTVDKNPITVEKFFKFFQHRREPFQELADFSKRCLVEIPLEPADTADVGGEPCPADFFVDFINKFPLLQYIEEAGKSTGIHAKNAVTDDMVGDACELHDDHAHILHPFRDLDVEQLFHRHVPVHVVYDRRTIVKTIGKRRDLV